MKELPLNALRAFALVWSEGGVRAAARTLGISHSSVSRHLAELEAWLGVSLVEKTAGARGIVFNPAGNVLGEAATRGLQDIAKAISTIRERRSANSVTLATVPSFATRWLLPRVPILEAAHPSIELSIIVEQRLTDFERDGVDLAIRMGTGPWRGVQAQPLMNEAVFPVVSPGYWARLSNPSQLAALKRVRLLHDRDPQTSWEAWRAAFGPHDLDVRSGPRLS